MDKLLLKVIKTLEAGLNELEYFDGEARLAANCLNNDKYHELLIKKADILSDLFIEMPEKLDVDNWDKKVSYFLNRVNQIKEAKDSKDYDSLIWLTSEAWLRVLFNELRALIN
jgi:hypothetical protein